MELQGHGDFIRCLQLEGQLLVSACGSTANRDCSIRTWNLASGRWGTGAAAGAPRAAAGICLGPGSKRGREHGPQAEGALWPHLAVGSMARAPPGDLMGSIPPAAPLQVPAAPPRPPGPDLGHGLRVPSAAQRLCRRRLHGGRRACPRRRRRRRPRRRPCSRRAHRLRVCRHNGQVLGRGERALRRAAGGWPGQRALAA
jgi:hypothetical protein